MNIVKSQQRIHGRYTLLKGDPTAVSVVEEKQHLGFCGDKRGHNERDPVIKRAEVLCETKEGEVSFLPFPLTNITARNFLQEA